LQPARQVLSTHFPPVAVQSLQSALFWPQALSAVPARQVTVPLTMASHPVQHTPPENELPANTLVDVAPPSVEKSTAPSKTLNVA
jgi:hypothetical protein